MRWLFLLLLLPLTSCQEKDPWAGDPSVPKHISFNQHIRPLLSRECLGCHRENKNQGGLRLDLASGVASVTTENSPKKSLLWEKIDANHPVTLPDRDKAILWRWIKQGTPSEGHWASLPLQNPDPSALPPQLSPTEPVTEEEFSFFCRTLFGREPNVPELEYLQRIQPTRGDLINSMMQKQDFVQFFKTRFLLLTGTKPVSPNGPFAPYLRWLDTEIANPSFALDDFLRKSLAGDLIPEAGQEGALASAWIRLPHQTGISSLTERISTNLLSIDPNQPALPNHIWPNIDKALPVLLPAFPPATRGHIPIPPFLPLHTPQQIEALRQGKELEPLLWKASKEVPQSATIEFAEWLAQQETMVTIPDLAVAFSFDEAEPIDNGPLPSAQFTSPITVAKGIQGSALAAPAGFEGLPLTSDGPFTLSFFLQLSHLPESQTSLFSASNTAGDSVGFRLDISPDSMTIGLVNGSSKNSLTAQANVLPQPQQWHHLTISYDGSRSAQGFQLWIDAQSIPLTIINDSLYGIARAPKNRLFYRYPTIAEAPPTLIEELQIYRSFLSELEIAHLRDGKALLAAVRDEFPREDLLFKYYLRSKNKETRTKLAQALTASREIAAVEDTALLVPIAGPTPLPKNRPTLPFLPLQMNANPDRLGFANWLVDDRNPLTPRVLASRLYQLVHGVSLLPSNEISDPWVTPTNPEFLDYLAREILVKEWNLRSILQTILLLPPERSSLHSLPEPAETSS